MDDYENGNMPEEDSGNPQLQLYNDGETIVLIIAAGQVIFTGFTVMYLGGLGFCFLCIAVVNSVRLYNGNEPIANLYMEFGYFGFMLIVLGELILIGFLIADWSLKLLSFFILLLFWGIFLLWAIHNIKKDSAQLFLEQQRANRK